ncbi:hypothetical protein [Ornithinimicrobium kibberense]|uniref:hypothetical protein n=1 Tax=Ornithinimicrobium kibberense TaxID=282060 RepID=UPI0036236382
MHLLHAQPVGPQPVGERPVDRRVVLDDEHERRVRRGLGRHVLRLGGWAWTGGAGRVQIV